MIRKKACPALGLRGGNRFSDKIMPKLKRRDYDPIQSDRILIRYGSITYGAVSFAIERTCHAGAARQWPVAAGAADVGFSAMGASARTQPPIPDAMGAYLAIRRSHPLRVPAAAAPLRRGYRGRPLLSLRHLPRVR